MGAQSTSAASCCSRCAYGPTTIVLKPCLSTKFPFVLIGFFMSFDGRSVKQMVMSWDVVLKVLYIWQGNGKGMYIH